MPPAAKNSMYGDVDRFKNTNILLQSFTQGQYESLYKFLTIILIKTF